MCCGEPLNIFGLGSVLIGTELWGNESESSEDNDINCRAIVISGQEEAWVPIMAGTEGMERRGDILRYCLPNVLQEILSERSFIWEGRLRKHMKP